MGIDAIRYGNEFFKFYRTWLNVIREMPEEVRAETAYAILRYYDGEEIGDALDERAIGLVGVAKTQIDYDRRKNMDRRGQRARQRGDGHGQEG